MDVGAFELQPPVITSLSPSSTPKGTAVTLTINGTGFLNTPNTTVTFAGLSPALTPTSITGTQIVVSISSALLFTAASSDSADASPGISLPVNVVVNNPDASGLTGPTHVISSAPATFNIAQPLQATVTPVSPGAQTNTEGDVLSGATAVTVTSNDPDANSFTDVVGGVDTLPPGLSISLPV